MRKEQKKGGEKSPPKGDTTKKRRQSKRTAQLNAKAQAAGWTGISEYLTAIINDEQQIPSKSAI